MDILSSNQQNFSDWGAQPEVCNRGLLRGCGAIGGQGALPPVHKNVVFFGQK